MSDLVNKLNKILHKAEKKGFEFRTNSEVSKIDYKGFGRFDATILNNEDGKEYSFIFHWNELVFNHNFAKCFFDEDSYKEQLKILVLQDNPIEYLSNFCNEN